MDQPSCECVKRYHGYTDCKCEEPAPFVPCSFSGEHKVRSLAIKVPGACSLHSRKILKPKSKRVSPKHAEDSRLKEYEEGIIGIIGRIESKLDTHASGPREPQRGQNQSSGSSPRMAASPKRLANTEPAASPVANTSARSQRNRTRPIENSPQEGAHQMVLSIRPKQDNNSSTRAKTESSSSTNKRPKENSASDTSSNDDTRGGKRRHSRRPE